MLQDEKVSGTIHIAFGRNGIFGGQNPSNSHVDFLVTRPTLTIYYSTNTSPRTIMQTGRFLI
jgi:leucyl aminopeptidase (aminopeptidase T)